MGLFEARCGSIESIRKASDFADLSDLWIPFFKIFDVCQTSSATRPFFANDRRLEFHFADRMRSAQRLFRFLFKNSPLAKSRA